VVDDIAGTTHQVYGGLADPTYLIDRDGRVAFYNMWTHAPTLHEAIEELLKQDGRGVVMGGTHRTPHLLASMTDGWKGLRRGFPQSAVELELSAPGNGEFAVARLSEFARCSRLSLCAANRCRCRLNSGLAIGAGSVARARLSGVDAPKVMMILRNGR
jgi:hypothetical protein